MRIVLALVGVVGAGVVMGACSSKTTDVIAQEVALDAGTHLGAGAPDATVNAAPEDAGGAPLEAQADAPPVDATPSDSGATDAPLEAMDAARDAPLDGADAGLDGQSAPDAGLEAGGDSAPDDAAVTPDANIAAAARCVKGSANGAYPPACGTNPWGCLYEEDGGIPQTACNPIIYGGITFIVGTLADGEEVTVGSNGNGLLECCAAGGSPY